jgi:ATP-dependent Clp protease adaptor protein ClpS
MAPPKTEGDSGVIVETRTERKTKKPPLYKVLLHNDDYTTREFVVEILRIVFHHSEQTALQIMMAVHNNGLGVAGVYTFEIAETKIRTVEAMAKEHEFPLRLTMEPDDGDD